MKIHKVEMSPFPMLVSTTETRFTFNKVEIAALRRAAKIIDDAEHMIASHLGGGARANLSEINVELAMELFSHPGCIVDAHGDNGFEVGEPEGVE